MVIWRWGYGLIIKNNREHAIIGEIGAPTRATVLRAPVLVAALSFVVFCFDGLTSSPDHISYTYYIVHRHRYIVIVIHDGHIALNA